MFEIKFERIGNAWLFNKKGKIEIYWESSCNENKGIEEAEIFIKDLTDIVLLAKQIKSEYKKWNSTTGYSRSVKAGRMNIVNGYIKP